MHHNPMARVCALYIAIGACLALLINVLEGDFDC